MSFRLIRPLFRASQTLRSSGINAGEPSPKLSQQLTHADPRQDHKRLWREARKDPELHVCIFPKKDYSLPTPIGSCAQSTEAGSLLTTATSSYTSLPLLPLALLAGMEVKI